MSSDDSDDEPLSLLVAKKLKQSKSDYEASTPDEDSEDSSETDDEQKNKVSGKNNFSKIRKSRALPPPTIVERPMDVWLYFKDLTVSGPYSCLLCPEWFINKTKIVVHYILNHKKDFCGICRYFVPDQEHWVSHQQFHCPWVCSQCPETFPSEADLRVHFSLSHNLVHCRLCSFMITDDGDYDRHLFKKHNILEVAHKDASFPWELEYDGSTKFVCLFCSKSIIVTDFFRHFMCFHRYTLKCFSMMLSGKEVPFTIHGANISAEFLSTHFTDQTRCGYVDVEPKLDEKAHNDDSSNFIDALIPEIKQEVVSNPSENDILKTVPDQKPAQVEIVPNDDEQKLNEIMAYSGEEIFDVTSIEVIVLQDMCRLYIDEIMREITEESLQKKRELDFSLIRNNTERPLECPICEEHLFNIVQFLSHLTKTHSVHCVPVYSCRLCLQRFDTEAEYRKHVALEIKDFNDLWLCQYCDLEFDNREDTREHLKIHLNEIMSESCCSPHLGFKCRYCPYLFWNETEREDHTRMTHASKWREEFYKCCMCSIFYSDKVFFSYHFLEKHSGNGENLIYLLKCMICSITTPNIQIMKEHFTRKHPDSKKLFCCLPPCKYKPMAHAKSFKMHKRLVHARGLGTKGAGPSLNCAVCSREFNNAKACGTHMTLAHGPGRFKCKLCSDALQTCDERKLHYLLKHPGQFHFECKLCKKTFQYKSSLYIHRSNVHFKTQETFTCNYCNKEFQKKDSYREHLQIHEGPRHTCSYCPMRFVQRSNMLRHERRHTGERPYSCPQCPRTFSDKGACTAHTRTHNRDTLNECMYCGQTFVQKSKLKYHIRKHTGEGLETCQICSKIFTSTYYLREHMKTHDGKPGIPCPICQRPFSEKSNLIRHLRRVHSSMGQQSCPICNKQLTSMVGLRKHLYTHSRVKPYSCLHCKNRYTIKKSVIKHLRKRHNVTSGSEKHYHLIEPKECNFGLDENILTAIFGNTKSLIKQKIRDNFVKYPVVIKQEEGQNKAGEGDSEKTNTCDEDNIGTSALEPTNFVSVKIEPCDSDTEEEA